MAFNPNNRDYEIMTDGELATLLANFNPEFIIDVVNVSLKQIYRPYNFNVPNMVSSYEIDFKTKLETYPMFSDEITNTRDTILNVITRTLCTYFNLQINPATEMDNYSVAYYLYEVFVSNFTNNLVMFFSSFILKEYSNIFTNLGFVDTKKSKDSTTIYAKRVFVDPKLGIVVSKLDTVLKSLVNLDVNLVMIFDTIYGQNTPLSIALKNTIMDRGDFYKQFFCKYILDESTFATTMTMIELEIQGNAEMTKIDMNKEEIRDEHV